MFKKLQKLTTMAGTGNDPQKQLLSIIRNFATEKSQGGIISFFLRISHSFNFHFNFRALISIQTMFLILPWNLEERRVVTLRKQIETLKSELSDANEELEKSKRCKELVEQELKGFELHLFLSEASVQTLEVSYLIV